MAAFQPFSIQKLLGGFFDLLPQLKVENVLTAFQGVFNLIIIHNLHEFCYPLAPFPLNNFPYVLSGERMLERATNLAY